MFHLIMSIYWMYFLNVLSVQTVNFLLVSHNADQTILQTVHVEVTGSEAFVQANLMFNSGSDQSFVSVYGGGD